MGTNTIEIEPKEKIYLLDRLSRLLEEQINIIRRSDVNGNQIEDFSKQTDSIVRDIVESGILELEELRHQREHLRRLYNSLNLAVIARKDEAEKQLKQVCKGKKTLVTYRNNI